MTGMGKYDRLTDEQLIERLGAGEREIMDHLMVKYKSMVRKKARAMYLLGGENEDLIQEGMIGLIKAVRDFDPSQGTSFSSFAELCVSRQMYTAVQASTRKKHMPLNTYISLYGAQGEAEEAELMNAIPADSEKSPEELFIDRENVEILERTIEKELSAFEKQVLDLYITGMHTPQIARVLGRDAKSTDNALSRIRSKLRKAIGDEGRKRK